MTELVLEVTEPIKRINYFISNILHKPYFITNNFRLSKILQVNYSYYIDSITCKDILSGNIWSSQYIPYSDEILHSLNIPFIEE